MAAVEEVGAGKEVRDVMKEAVRRWRWRTCGAQPLTTWQQEQKTT